MKTPISTRNWKTAVAIAFSSILVLGGCSLMGESAQPPREPGSSSPAEEEPEEPEIDLEYAEVDRAVLLTAQYNYDEAIEILEPFDSPEATSALKDAEDQKAQAVLWPDNATIPHIFFHALIVDTDRAFASSSRQGYLDYMVTMDEFIKMIDQIYANDWVLVGPHDVAELDDAGVMQFQEIWLPPGKKPLVLSQDDVSYYEYMEGTGFATDLKINDEGRVVNTYTDAAGVTVEGSYDVPPIIDDFVDEHPDFSYRGAKGILGLTGYNGVLGYRTSDSEYPDSPTLEEDKATAKEVADAMKDNGWIFASHAWGHINMTDASMEKLTADSDRWDEEVRPILGDTDQLIYPFGADISGVALYSQDNPKFKLLHGHGFTHFYNVDASAPHWIQKTDESLRQARINVDGLRMGYDKTGSRQALAPYFDIDSVIDPARSK